MPVILMLVVLAVASAASFGLGSVLTVLGMTEYMKENYPEVYDDICEKNEES